MSEDLVQTPSEQVEAPSGHQDLEAKARELACKPLGYACEADLHLPQCDRHTVAIASALSEAYEAGRDLVQTQAEPTTELSGHPNAETVAVLTEREACAQLMDARCQEYERFAANPEDGDEMEMLGTAAIYRGAAYSIRARGAQVTAPESQQEFEPK